ncbi:MAG: hypothetical protein Fur006_36490 [Coleofasciculaceae cyanobacterium]
MTEQAILRQYEILVLINHRGTESTEERKEGSHESLRTATAVLKIGVRSQNSGVKNFHSFVVSEKLMVSNLKTPKAE